LFEAFASARPLAGVQSPRFQRRKKKPDASPTLLKLLVVRIFRRTFQRLDLAKGRFKAVELDGFKSRRPKLRIRD